MRASPPVSWSPPESTPVVATLWQRSSPGGPACSVASQSQSNTRASVDRPRVPGVLEHGVFARFGPAPARHRSARHAGRLSVARAHHGDSQPHGICRALNAGQTVFDTSPPPISRIVTRSSCTRYLATLVWSKVPSGRTRPGQSHVTLDAGVHRGLRVDRLHPPNHRRLRDLLEYLTGPVLALQGTPMRHLTPGAICRRFLGERQFRVQFSGWFELGRCHEERLYVLRGARASHDRRTMAPPIPVNVGAYDLVSRSCPAVSTIAR